MNKRYRFSCEGSHFYKEVLMSHFVFITGFIALALVLCLIILLIRRLSADERDGKDQRKNHQD